MNETGGAKAPEMMAISREKRWDEMDDTQRIALLRREVRFLIDRNHALYERICALETHSHTTLGQITVPLKNPDLNSPIGYQRRNPLD